MAIAFALGAIAYWLLLAGTIGTSPWAFVISAWRLAEHWKAGLGGLYAFDFAPSSSTASYGGTPHGAMAFVRLVAE